MFEPPISESEAGTDGSRESREATLSTQPEAQSEDRERWLAASIRDGHVAGELVDGLDASFLLTDTELRVVGWNAAAQRMFRFPTAEVLGRSVHELWAPPGSRRLIEEIRQTMMRGTSWTGNLWFRRGDGTDVLSRGTRSAVTDENGTVIGFYAMTFDVYGQHTDMEAADLPAIAAGVPATMRDCELLVLPGTRRAFVREQELALTETEFAILEHLVSEVSRVVSADELSMVVWGYPTHGMPNFVQAHISRLRTKLDALGAGYVIRTVRGEGYVIAG